MVLYNWSTKELTAKIVYYGPGLGGKSTNLQWIHDQAPIKNKGKMLSLNTEADRTLFFDFLPIELGSIRGNRTRIQLYTVPGQVFYNATRRMVLKGADAVVFVCDSQESMLDANLESLENMRQNLEANEIDSGEIPLVYQFNKRDLPNALPIEILNERLNPGGQSFFEAVATRGVGVEETLKAVTMLVFRSLAERYGDGDAGPSPHPPSTAAQASPIRSPMTAPSPRPTAAAPARPPAASWPARPPSPPPIATVPPVRPDPQRSGPDAVLDALELDETPFEVDDIEVDVLPSEEESFQVPPRSPSDPHSTLASSMEETLEIRERLRSRQQQDESRTPPPLRSALSSGAAASSFASSSGTIPPDESEITNAGAILSAPVSVEIVDRAGEHEVVIPVDITLPKGAVQISLYLRLNLNLRTAK
jgi:signal recognition particle receptor subunit beta